MAVKKNATAATSIEPKKVTKNADVPVAEQTKEAPKKIDKHNHELERARNAKAFAQKVETKDNGSKKGKEDLSILESSIKASSAAKAARGKKPGNKKNEEA